MIRALIVFVVLAILAAGAAWLADHPGRIEVDWGGWEVSMSTAAAAIVLIVLIAVAAGLYRFWRFLMTSPVALSSWRAEGRRRKGYQALSRGLVAVAAGDAKEARKLAQRTSEQLDDRPLALLLSAQAAQLEGDEAAARRFFEAMRDAPETEFLGLRGLLVQARRAGRDSEALGLARRAFELRPATPWVLQELFALEARHGDLERAGRVLEQGARHRVLNEDEMHRRRAALRLAEAQAADRQGESRQAIDFARKALAERPDLAPAAALAARLHLAADEKRKARKLLEAAWRAGPHPDIAAAYLAVDGRSDPEAQLATLKRLTDLGPEHREGRIALAAAALRADDTAAASTVLAPLTDGTPEARVCYLMAEVAEKAGDAESARDWLRKGALAPGAAAWHCSECNHDAPAWQLHCPACGAFDSLSWSVPAGASPASVLALEAQIRPAEKPPAAHPDEPEHQKQHVSDIAPTATEA